MITRIGSSLATSRCYALASKLYPPLLLKDVTSKVPMHSASQRAMLENGLIEHAGSHGLFHLLPLAVRALDKLTKIIFEEMNAIGAQRVQLPTMVGRKLMDQTERWSAFGNDLFRFNDRMGDEYCLAPTHEESITHLVSGRLQQLSTIDSTPLLLYQMTSKFRDEMKSRYGLLRCREFLMKDLYSFDVDENEARKTYELCSQAYRRIFETRLAPLKKPLMRVVSDVGTMGGSLSHEYHFENVCGENQIDYCLQCRNGLNRELLQANDVNDTPSDCTNCETTMTTFRSVEIAHTFLLGTKYSEAFDAAFLTPGGRKLAFMGCYGIGVTRLLAVLIDCNLNKSGQIRWPLSIAPYSLCIIPPKAGSKEENLGGTKFAVDVLESLGNIHCLKGEIIYDDRLDLTVGRRLLDAKRIGYPFIVVANKTVVQDSIPKFEFFDLTQNEDKMELLTHEDLFSRIRSLNDFR